MNRRPSDPAATLVAATVFFVLVSSATDADAQRRGRSAAERATGPAPSEHAFDPDDAWGLTDEPVRGPADALVTIVEFSDFECPYCSRVQSTLGELLADPEVGDDTRLVFLHMPLAFHPAAQVTAEAAVEAHRQGLFWEFHDEAFGRHADLSRDEVGRIAADIGMDVDALDAALDDDVHAATVDGHAELAGELGVRGTPSFLINGRLLPGARPLEDFVSAVRDERDAMRALIGAGVPADEAYAQRVAHNLAEAEEAAEVRAEAAAPTVDLAQRVYVDVTGMPIRGNPDAPVTIVEFSDFECPFCQRVQQTLATILQEYPDRVRIVFAHNPLAFHQHAEPAARAAIAAANQGMFWEYHDLLFADIHALSAADLEAHAESLGLDIDRWRADLDASATSDVIAANQQLAADIAARGTPQFFVNGHRVRGAQPIEVFRETIDLALAEADDAMANGIDATEVYETVLADMPRALPR